MTKSAKKAKARSKDKTAPKDLRASLLQAALPGIAFDGWHDDLCINAATKAKINPQDAQEAFPQGTLDMILYFADWADAQMLARTAALKPAPSRIRDKITEHVWQRLVLLTPYKEAVRLALAALAKPPHSLHLPRQLWQTADHIWWAAGDTSTDYNHYSKRFLLSGVISSTAIYWLKDQSTHHADTRDFLEKRIENVLKIGQKISSFKNKVAQR